MREKLKKNLITCALTSLVLLLLFVTGLNNTQAAASESELTGWGWSSVPGHTPEAGLGWISFNSRNAGASGSYAVKINNSTGEMSGYAWTLHGYSLTFNKAELNGCPSAPCSARYNKNNHSLSGWAKFMYEGDGGGWTGWLDLSGVGGSEVNGVVTFSGNASGGNVAGNVSFDRVSIEGQLGLGFDYTLSNSGNVEVTKSGSPVSGQTTITKTLIDGDPQSVDLLISGVPSGVSYAISSRTCIPTCVSTITFTVNSSAPNGTYQIRVEGDPLGPSTQPTTFNLIINGSTDAIISCVASPATSVKVGQSVTWRANVSGGRPPYTYSWAGTNIPTSPAPTTNPYSITYTTVGRKTAQATVTDSDGRTSACNPPGSVYVNLDPKFEEF